MTCFDYEGIKTAILDLNVRLFRMLLESKKVRLELLDKKLLMLIFSMLIFRLSSENFLSEN